MYTQNRTVYPTLRSLSGTLEFFFSVCNLKSPWADAFKYCGLKTGQDKFPFGDLLSEAYVNSKQKRQQCLYNHIRKSKAERCNMHICLPTVYNTAIHCNSTLDLHDIFSGNKKGSCQIVISFVMDCSTDCQRE